ncbi:MAG: hypothetical protein QOD56_428 [Gammaproteobacteria bacterium]|jgi:hypothetical protein|nr:hypothetical protein [Gammaproteobacteria bacterium]
MQKPKSINELFKAGGKRLTDLKAKSLHRSSVLEHVCAALPAKLAENVITAGIDQGRLTIGVAGAQWATRLRYAADSLRSQVGGSLAMDIQSVRVRVVPPPT